jgi:glutaredoxin 3
MNKQVIIYSTPTCHFCHLAKEYFDTRGITYTNIDVSTNVDKRKEMIDLTGQMGVPVICIGDEIVVGFDEAKINELLAV